MLWNQRTGHIIDGHERVELAIKNGDQEIPRMIVDLSEDEERLVLATFDPIGALAQTDADMLTELLRSVPKAADLLEDYRVDEISMDATVEEAETSGLKSLTFTLKIVYADRLIEAISEAMEGAPDLGPHKQANALFKLVCGDEA